jgi:hypothetical protein
MRRLLSVDGSMGPSKTHGQPEEFPVPRSLEEGPEQNPLAWEMVAAGRYMPRRIRGSFRGRELG